MAEEERQARIAQLETEIAERVAELASLARGAEHQTPTINPEDYVRYDDWQIFCQGKGLTKTASTSLWRRLRFAIQKQLNGQGTLLDIRLVGTWNPASEMNGDNKAYAISKASLRLVTETLSRNAIGERLHEVLCALKEER